MSDGTAEGAGGGAAGGTSKWGKVQVTVGAVVALLLLVAGAAAKISKDAAETKKNVQEMVAQPREAPKSVSPLCPPAQPGQETATGPSGPAVPHAPPPKKLALGKPIEQTKVKVLAQTTPAPEPSAPHPVATPVDDSVATPLPVVEKPLAPARKWNKKDELARSGLPFSAGFAPAER